MPLSGPLSLLCFGFTVGFSLFVYFHCFSVYKRNSKPSLYPAVCSRVETSLTKSQLKFQSVLSSSSQSQSFSPLMSILS